MSCIEVRNLHFSYRNCVSEELLNGIEFSLQNGEFVALIGRNGAGKSTLVKLLSGQLKPSDGKVLLNGEDIRKISSSQRAQIMAVVSQNIYNGFPFEVREIVAMGRIARRGLLGQLNAEDHHAVRNALLDCNLNGFEHRIFSELSGGERQLVLLAAALAQNSKILLLDEPTSAMDLGRSVEVMGLIRRFCRERGMTTLIISHNIELMSRYTDRIIALKEGNIIADGAPADIINSRLIFDLYGFKSGIIHGNNGEVLLSY